MVNADEILVLDKGRAIERGRHETLLAADGAYAALWRRQLREQEEQPQSPPEERAAPLEAEADELRRDRDEVLLRASEL